MKSCSCGGCLEVLTHDNVQWDECQTCGAQWNETVVSLPNVMIHKDGKPSISVIDLVKKFEQLEDSALVHIAMDATAAKEANPHNPNNSYYLAEIMMASIILNARIQTKNAR